MSVPDRGLEEESVRLWRVLVVGRAAEGMQREDKSSGVMDQGGWTLTPVPVGMSSGQQLWELSGEWGLQKGDLGAWWVVLLLPAQDPVHQAVGGRSQCAASQ